MAGLIQRQRVVEAAGSRLADDAGVVGIVAGGLGLAECCVRRRPAVRRDGQRHRAGRAERQVLEADRQRGRFGQCVDDRGRAFARPEHRPKVERPLAAEPPHALLAPAPRYRLARAAIVSPIASAERTTRAQCRSRSGITPSKDAGAVEDQGALPGAVVGGAHDRQVAVVPASVEPGENPVSERHSRSPEVSRGGAGCPAGRRGRHRPAHGPGRTAPAAPGASQRRSGCRGSLP